MSKPLIWLGLRRPNTWERPTALDKLLFSPLIWLTTILYHLILLLRGRPFRPPRGQTPIRVICLSDTHGLTVPSVPDGDLLIHAGDLTQSGTAQDIQRAVDWLDALPHRHKVVIAGNHDSWLDPAARLPQDRADGAKVDWKGLTYLENRAVTLEFAGERKLNVFGGPALPKCGPDHFAFQYKRQSHPWKGLVPDETDVLVTHTPPRGHLDLDLGCTGLLEEVWRVKPKLHVFGHIHWGAGQESVYFDRCQRAYETLLTRRARGPILDFLPHAGWYDAFHVAWYGFKSIIWQRVMLGPGSNNGALLVNASAMHGNTGKLRKKIQAVDL